MKWEYQPNSSRQCYCDSDLHSGPFSLQERKNEALVHSISELQRKVGWGSVVLSTSTALLFPKRQDKESVKKASVWHGSHSQTHFPELKAQVRKP